METMELLAWAKGPGLVIATTIFLVGVAVRFLEMFMLGRKEDLSEARVANSGSYGWRTIVTRTIPDLSQVSDHIALIAGYVFHIGFFIILIFYEPHMLLFENVFGFGWPVLPMWLIDGISLLTMAGLLVALYVRMTDPVRRYLSRFSDYFAWFITFLPIFTGYLAYHRLLLPYNDMLVVHILSVELLMIAFPFTKLMHFFTLFMSRWYNGQMAGRKGVKV
jgi:nitrate reductase gamma subunit